MFGIMWFLPAKGFHSSGEADIHTNKLQYKVESHNALKET